MGGCASKPKEFENRPGSAPAEAPAASLEKADSVADVQEKANGGENKNENEAPLVDLSDEPRKEEAEESSKTEDANAETAQNKTEEAKVTAEVTARKVEAVAVGVEPTEKDKADKSDDPTSSVKDKTDAPLVSV